MPFVGFNFNGGSGTTCQTLANCNEKRVHLGVSVGAMGAMFGFGQDVSHAKNFFGGTPATGSSVFSVMSSLASG